MAAEYPVTKSALNYSMKAIISKYVKHVGGTNLGLSARFAGNLSSLTHKMKFVSLSMASTCITSNEKLLIHLPCRADADVYVA